jgi:DNA-binding response OmpR family regulator
VSARILVVNDDQGILELFRLLLESEGYEVHLSKICFEDVHDVERLRPDLIILDVKLGYHAEGLVLLQELKMYRPTSDIPVLLCTAAISLMREQEDVLREKGIPIVYKPFDIEELLTAVRLVLLPALRT